jgi:putative sterol carrier protein
MEQAMSHQFLSVDWLRDYQSAWNADPEVIGGLKGFSAWIEYGWADSDFPSVYLQVDNGNASAVAENAPTKIDFVMHATPENWRKICCGELNGRAALLTRKLQFKGSMITAMRYMGPFNASIALLGRVPHDGDRMVACEDKLASG